MTEVDNAATKEARRAAIESEHNGIRDAREKQYVADRSALEVAYAEDLAVIERNKRQAFIDDGLNSDGSDPQGRQQGLQV